jgi:hypothetical protein
MVDKSYLLKFKPGLSCPAIIAATAEIHGDHLALRDAEGKLAGLFLFDAVESWNEVERHQTNESRIARK